MSPFSLGALWRRIGTGVRRIGRALVKFLATTAMLLLLLLFGMGYAAAYVPPDVAWWLAPCGVLLPPVSLITGVVGVGLLVRSIRRRQAARLAGATLLLFLIALRFGPALIPPTLPAFSDEASGEPLRVMSFNASSSVDAGDEAASILDAVRQIQPHVLALQEAYLFQRPNRSSRTNPSLQVLLDAGYQFPDAMSPTRSVRQSVVSSDLSLDSLESIVLEPDLWKHAPSTVTRVRFRRSGQPVVLYNIHLHTVSALKPWTSEDFRVSDWQQWLHPDVWMPYIRSYREGALERARQARLIHQRIAREAHPVLVTGDFNSTRHHWVHRHIAHGLQEAYVHRGPFHGATYPAQRPLVRIDHILASEHWDVLDAFVPTIRTASDHRPVVALLRLKPDTTASSSQAARVGP